MRLAQLLTMAGGLPEQGREVIFRLRYRDPQGVPQVRDVTGSLHPLSEEEMQAAQAAVLAEGRTLSEGEELVVQMLHRALRDPDDLSKLLIETPADLRALRAGLVAPQFDWFLAEYRALIAQEYPALVTDEDMAAMQKDAEGFSTGGQPGPG